MNTTQLSKHHAASPELCKPNLCLRASRGFAFIMGFRLGSAATFGAGEDLHRVERWSDGINIVELITFADGSFYVVNKRGEWRDIPRR